MLRINNDINVLTLLNEKDKEGSQDRPQDKSVTKAMDIIYLYTENNDDCQFFLQEFKRLLNDYIQADKIIKSKLIERYGRNIVWCNKSGSSTIICFRSIEHEILMKSWYESRLQNEEEERL